MYLFFQCSKVFMRAVPSQVKVLNSSFFFLSFGANGMWYKQMRNTNEEKIIIIRNIKNDNNDNCNEEHIVFR